MKLKDITLTLNGHELSVDKYKLFLELLGFDIPDYESPDEMFTKSLVDLQVCRDNGEEARIDMFFQRFLDYTDEEISFAKEFVAAMKLDYQKKLEKFQLNSN